MPVPPDSVPSCVQPYSTRWTAGDGRTYHRFTPLSETSIRLEAQGRLVARARLTGRVRDALETGAVLLTAGAGSGKTTILDQTLGRSGWQVAWVGCSDAERAPGVLLIRIMEAIASAVPGASDALAERLAAAPERVDAPAATRELVAELARLLVEPLVLVVDDAEHLDGAAGSLRVLDELLRAQSPLLRVVVASRRALALHVAKPRAAGRLIELTAADLAFDAEECAELLRRRTGLDPSGARVEEVMKLTEGWPLGIALAAGLVERATQAGDVAGALGDLRSASDLRAYLSEELVDSLGPELRAAALDSSVVPVVTPAAAQALDLPEDFEARIEAAGLLVRRVPDGRGFVYHPLLRDFLLERLRAERTPAQWRALHAAVAPALDQEGDAVGAIEHWLEAHSWAQAVATIEREGLTLARTAPELIPQWLSLLPEAERAYPTMRALVGQLRWRAGDNAEAIVALQEAIRGFRDRPNATAEWIARSILVDLLFATGAVDQVEAAVEGWDGPAAAAAGALAPATAMYGAAAFASFARFEESERLAQAASRHPKRALLAPLQALQRLFIDLPAGRVDEVCEQLRATARALEHYDPFRRRQHVVGVLAIILADRGDGEEALATWLQLRETIRGRGAPLYADVAHAGCSLLHARAGRLAEAEAELAQVRGVETSARSYMTELAPAAIASLRGDAAATVAAAERTLAAVAGGSILFRYWAGADLVWMLADVGRSERARAVLDDTLELVDEHYPGDLGRFPRGRLLGLRAWLAHLDGDSERSAVALRALWDTTGESLRYVLRRDWERLRPLVWQALEEGTLDPEPAVEQIGSAFPGGLELLPFLDHPLPEVRRAALAPAIGSGDPAALARLSRLQEDADPDVAVVASRAVDRLGTALPPLRFEVLGDFAVRRGAWVASDRDWSRPLDARLVRFLLVHLDMPVPEDVILEALWPELPASNARRSLSVAASRARKVLDPTGAERSVIEHGDETYRLVLGERDVVDAEAFRGAAEAALAAGDGEGPALLERARSLWHGEPLPQERYTDWATAYRERLIDRYIAVLTGLVNVAERGGDHPAAIDAARELVDLDPLNEDAQRALIRAYARTGRRGHALRQYLECRRALVAELGVEPAEATSRLQARVLAGEAV